MLSGRWIAGDDPLRRMEPCQFDKPVKLVMGSQSDGLEFPTGTSDHFQGVTADTSSCTEHNNLAGLIIHRLPTARELEGRTVKRSEFTPR